MEQHNVLGLIRLYRRTADPDTLLSICQTMRPLVRRVAYLYAHRKSVEYEDLTQLGYMGVIKGVRKFDLTHDRFIAFFRSYIEGEIMNFLRDHGHLMYIPRPILAAMKKRYKETQDATEFASAIPLSLDIVMQGKEGDVKVPVFDPPAEADPKMSVSYIMLKDALQKLPPRQARVITLYYYVGLSEREIAEMIQCSQMQVSRLKRAAVEMLRGELKDLVEGEPMVVSNYARRLVEDRAS